ncbi:BamA/TamA family outer membrane protein [Cytophagales bacterium LB-30]|uniref:BamA/TamA family outer membrane protein n=1 Tax=Shiella aurantiaca TaxID=3058365 RepID=A0ABT8F2L6_9BACT|nr:BamA/TamA family outer membrane protein [Shiella aurantiaca]MDN4164700.1 BamA/TamA family outer membrane protein [Shiella aurantiaca]
MKGLFFTISLWLFSACYPVLAQVNLEVFGKNRMQYKEFEWRSYSSENFDIYFYDGGETIVREAADFLEAEYINITDFIGYSPYAKSKIFLYNSHTDLLQSNVGLHEPGFDIGGQTNFMKLQVEVAYTGSRAEFKRELIYKVAQMLIGDMMFGGSLTDMFQSSYLMSLPEWFINGAAAYIAYGWDATMDDHIRDILVNDNVKMVNRMATDRATVTGQSIWNYMVETYGRSSVSNVLNLTRIIRNEERSIGGTLAVPYKQFMSDWRMYYLSMAEKMASSYQNPVKSDALDYKNKRDIKFYKLRFSPDGSKLVYTTNLGGRYHVIVRDIATEKEKIIFKAGYRTINQEPDNQLPLVDWKDDNTVGIIAAKKGRYTLWLHELSSNSSTWKDLGRFNQVKDLSFSTESNLAVFSADINAQSDIYIISLKSNGVKRVTNDPFDDLNPRFIANSKAIVFSSNRDSDTLATRIKTLPVEKVSDNFNLYTYHIDTTRNILGHLTTTYGRDWDPRYDGEHVYYLSSQKGVDNLFRYSLKDSISIQTTAFNSSILQYDLDFTNNRIAYVAIDNAREHIFLSPIDLKANLFTLPTTRQEVTTARKLSRRLGSRSVAEQKSLEIKPDSVRTISLQDSLLVQQKSQAEDTIDATGIINTDNYVFDSDLIKKQQSKSILSNYLKLQKESKLLGPLPYETRFTADNILTSFIIDPLIGFGIQLELQMNDMLEDHRFYGGVIATTNFRSGRVFGEYQYLKRKADYHIRFDRDAVELRILSSDQVVWKKYALTQFETGFSLPLSVTNRLRISGNYSFQSMNDLDPYVLTSSVPGTDTVYAIQHQYTGAKAEWIFDNTTRQGLNVLNGTRIKVGLKTYMGINDFDRSFNNFSTEIRHYQKIHREFIFAARAFYGNFFGRSPQHYMLGGMENWLGRRTENENFPNAPTEGRDDSNILFNEYVTNLRGFDYNTFQGNEAFVFNAELRMPLFRYLYKDYISSNFFRNFQITSFFDFGSSWSGVWPFNPNNSINTVKTTAGNNFDVILRNYKNPWLYSYGVGIRTVFLGYYLKIDMAYPVEDFQRAENPRFHFSLGFDF